MKHFSINQYSRYSNTQQLFSIILFLTYEHIEHMPMFDVATTTNGFWFDTICRFSISLTNKIKANGLVMLWLADQLIGKQKILLPHPIPDT